MAADFHQSHFWLVIPVASLQVDVAKARSVEGEDFAKLPDAEAIAGTTKNMFGGQGLEIGDDVTCSYCFATAYPTLGASSISPPAKS